MRLDPDKEYLACAYCGNVHVPDVNTEGIRVLDEPADLACPVCSIPLVHAAAASQRILYCNRCRGMLIGMNVFMTVVHDLRSRRQSAAEGLRPPHGNELDRQLQCPKCHESMDTHIYGGAGNVVIDTCEDCEVNWLDFGELDRIVRSHDREFAGEPWV